MSSGPIEFIGEEPGHEVPSGEYAGDDGLIQPVKPELLNGDPEASGGNVLDGRVGDRGGVRDADGVVRRAGMRTLSSGEGWTGVEDPAWSAVAAAQGMGSDAVVDPLTGRAASGELNVSGGEPGEFDDYKL